MKKALVLAGGGTRGAYQTGAIHALRELHQDDWNIITGTSIGALNGMILTQRDYDALDQLWHTITPDKFIKDMVPTQFDLNSMISEGNAVASFFKNYLKEKGADISPLIEQIHSYFNPEKFYSSDIEFGCITMNRTYNKPVYVNRSNMKKEPEKWLLASASAFPAFPVCKIGDNDYIDGGYFDNLPIDYAFRMGADEVIAIDLNDDPQHPNYIDRKQVTYIFPKISTGSFLDFDPEKMKKMERLGYLDTMKTFGTYSGVKYAFEKTELPSYEAAFSLQLILLEERVRLANPINKKLRSADLVVNHLRDQQHKSHLSEEEIYFGLMDNLMDFCEDADITKVYTRKEAEDMIMKTFGGALQKDYEYAPGYDVSRIMEYTKTLDSKGITEKLIHGMKYEEHMVIPEEIRLTIYPFEEAMAKLVLAMNQQ